MRYLQCTLQNITASKLGEYMTYHWVVPRHAVMWLQALNTAVGKGVSKHGNKHIPISWALSSGYMVV